MKTARRTLLLAGIASFLAGVAIPQWLVGNPPHLHDTIATPIPHVWRADRDVQGWRKMFCPDSLEFPGARAPGRRARVAGR